MVDACVVTIYKSQRICATPRLGTCALNEWSIQKLFSPEHGFFGKAAAGEKVRACSCMYLRQRHLKL